MQAIPSLLDFDQLFAPQNLQQRLRTSKHVVLRTRAALKEFHEKMQPQKRHKVVEQMRALRDLNTASSEYCARKIGIGPAIRPKHVFMVNLRNASETRLAEILQHADAAHATFTAGHHGQQLPDTARHAQNRISTGVGTLPTYRFEQYTAAHGPSRRMHGGEFLARRDMHHVDFTAMNPITLYALIKEFKHLDHRDKHLDYFDDNARASKRLMLGPDNRILLNGVPADTRGTVEKKRFDAAGALITTPSGFFYTQSSGGDDHYAIYACSVDGDFYVHLDLRDHAGTFQHSSIMAGAQVTCAGTIVLADGRAVILSNNSGHYRPTAADLHDAMLLMREELGVDPRTVLITCKDQVGNYHLCSGATLLTLQAGQDILSLSGDRGATCIPWDTSSSPEIRALSIADLTTWAIAETADQDNTIARINRLRPWQSFVKPPWKTTTASGSAPTSWTSL